MKPHNNIEKTCLSLIQQDIQGPVLSCCDVKAKLIHPPTDERQVSDSISMRMRKGLIIIKTNRNVYRPVHATVDTVQRVTIEAFLNRGLIIY